VRNQSVSIATPQRVKCRLVASQTISEGNCYYVSKGRFHNTYVPIGIMTSTLALTYNSDNSITQNVRPEWDKQKLVYKRKKCTEKEYCAIINDLLNYLN
jgi:hypothetical protein